MRPQNANTRRPSVRLGAASVLLRPHGPLPRLFRMLRLPGVYPWVAVVRGKTHRKMLSPGLRHQQSG
jgi:hypothetical protein